MTTSKRNTKGGGRVIPMLLAPVILAGCATQAETPFRTQQLLQGQPVSQADADAVTASYRLAQLDDREGRLAATQSSNPKIRQLAAEIVAKANQLYPLLEDVIKKNGITPPRELPGDLTAQVERLRTKRGRAFDQQFLSDQIAAHRRAIMVFEAAQGQTQDPALRSLNELALPVVRDDLGQLEALQAS